MNNYQLDIYFR